MQISKISAFSGEDFMEAIFLPEVIEYAKANIEKAGLSDVITH